MGEPEKIWIVCTKLGDLYGWFYAAVSTEDEARGLAKDRRREGEEIIAAKSVRNVDHITAGTFCPVPMSDPYTGPLIPD
jgi:hypothetical protein